MNEREIDDMAKLIKDADEAVARSGIFESQRLCGGGYSKEIQTARATMIAAVITVWAPDPDERVWEPTSTP